MVVVMMMVIVMGRERDREIREINFREKKPEKFSIFFPHIGPCFTHHVSVTIFDQLIQPVFYFYPNNAKTRDVCNVEQKFYPLGSVHTNEDDDDGFEQ